MDLEEFVPRSYPEDLLKKDWSKRKCCFFENSSAFLDRIHDMEVREDDVWLVTMPKCGTTWMQELLWLVLHDFDFEGALNEHLEIRTPFLEFDYAINKDPERAIKLVDDLKSPRLIKTHLPLPLLPKQLWEKKPKLVYVYRNPKDAMVSGYYHVRSLGFEVGNSLEQHLRTYLEKESSKDMPFEHVVEFYTLRHEPWILYTSFERMKLDLRTVIRDVCTFLDRPILDDQMEHMLSHLSFEAMKDNPKVQHIWEFDQVRKQHNGPYEQHNFIRKGKVGGYKEELSPEMAAELDEWISQQLSTYNVSLEELLLLN